MIFAYAEKVNGIISERKRESNLFMSFNKRSTSTANNIHEEDA